MPKSIIISSVRESLTKIWQNKFLFVLLLILQIIFFAAFASINLAYQTKILENARAITDYLGTQNLDDASVASNVMQQKSVLGDDPLSISRNFNEIVKNFRIYLAYTLALFVLFGSIAWAITDRLISKDNISNILRNLFRKLIILASYLGLIFLFFLLLLNISFTDIAEGTRLLAKYAVFLSCSIILAYFMIVSLSLSHNTRLRDIVQKTLVIGIKKGHYILLAHIINILLFALSTFLLFYFFETSIFILLLSLALTASSFAFGRALMTNVVEKLAADVGG